MLKSLGKIFGINTSSREDEVKQQFENDYMREKSFLSGCSARVSEHVSECISSSYEAASREDEGGLISPIHHIFACVKSIHISLWLERTGYGKKLALKERQLVYKDSYGDYCLDDWNHEVKKFISKRLHDLCYELDTSIPEIYRRYAKLLDMESVLPAYMRLSDYSEDDLIEDFAFEISTNLAPYDESLRTENLIEFDCIKDPYEYEKAVSLTLIGLGWDSQTTIATGDQGADVVAEKSGRKLVVQCKLYTSPVGNGSVQEVSAAQQFYRADYSAVVSNQSFTKSAMQLADSLGVYLLHHSQLSDFDGAIFPSTGLDIEVSDIDEQLDDE